MKITEVRESVNEVDERVVPKGMLILTCRTQRRGSWSSRRSTGGRSILTLDASFGKYLPS